MVETRAAKPKRGLQVVVSLATLIILALLLVIPLSFADVVVLDSDPNVVEVRQIQILVVTSLLLYGVLYAYLSAGYEVHKKKGGDRVALRTKRDVILNGVSVATSLLVVFMTVVELLALLAYLNVIQATSSASIAFASNYLLFATFTLLFLDLMVIARTSYASRVEVKKWHRAISYVLIALSILVLVVALLVGMGILSTGVFAGIEDPGQSVYIVTLGVLFQLFVFKLLLRYPPIASVMLREIQAAKRAGKDMRDQIQRRALRTYMLGLLFVLASIFFIGGLATQRLAVQGGRTSNFLIVLYIIVGVVILGITATRYFQVRFLAARDKRKETGELIGKKRKSKDEVVHLLLYGFSGFFGIMFFVLGILTFLGVLPLERTYGTDFLIMMFLFGIGPYGFYRGFIVKRQRAIDDKFPDFLRDLAESQRAGMTLPRALYTAAKGTYGALTPEIKKMSAVVEWGVSFTDALGRFANRVNTPLIQRASVLITEAASAGGNVVDILTAASEDAREIKQILEERKRQMSIYSMIIYISFFVYLVVIFILAAQFLPAFETAVGAASGEQVGGLAFVAFDVEDYIRVFFHGALIQAIGGGLVAGVMTGGKPNDGLKHSVIMTIVAWITFRLIV